ncbi:MAG: stage V sporulation protein AB [Lachnospiraceae bacterium]|nr:stage V sporulation protein AB [Lachnospiraceae bacterium]
MFKYLLLILMGVSYGALASAGVFTVLIAVGLIPRFAGKTHTNRYVFLYEEMVVFGTITGSFLTVFGEYSQVAAFLQERMPQYDRLWVGLGNVVMILFGLFCGMFVGCLALAIAEMLDSIPIFSRRVSLRHGIGLVILSMAIGKLVGSICYFVWELHRTV